MIKLIKEINILKIKSGHVSSKKSEFVDLFAKSSIIMNTGVLPKNYKKLTKKNWY